MVICVPHDRVDVDTFQVYCRDQTRVLHVISYLKCDIMAKLPHVFATIPNSEPCAFKVLERGIHEKHLDNKGG